MEDGNDIFGDTGNETITGSNSTDDIWGEDGADILLSLIHI